MASAVTVYVSISGFVSLIGISIGIRSSTVRWKICAKTAGTKNYNSIIWDRRRNTVKEYSKQKLS